MSTPLKILLGILILLSVTMMVLVGVLVYAFSQSPDTFVYTGQQMKKGHLQTVRDLGLLEDGEAITYFYSDALLDIRNGMYFVTEQRLVLYSDDWEDPRFAVPFEAIVDVDVEYNESFFIDSEITITLDDGEVWTFPVSSERGRDKAFFEHIETRMSKIEAEEEPAA